MRGRPTSRRPLKVKMISPAKTAADSVYWRSIKYSLVPPLGLVTLAGYLDPDDEVDLQDEHVEKPKSANDAGLQLADLGSHGASRLTSRSQQYTVE